MRFAKWSVALFLVLPGVAFLPWSPAAAGPGKGNSAPVVLEGVEFPGTYARGDVVLKLRNVALLRYKVFFRGYVVGLYLPEGTDPSEALRDVPKRMEFSYFWSIPGGEFGKSGEEVLSRNVDGATMGRLRERLDRIDRAYRDIRPGDRYALTYLPGKGTELAWNGTPLAVLKGADFAAAYFSIWLGPRPLDEGLKKDLLREG